MAIRKERKTATGGIGVLGYAPAPRWWELGWVRRMLGVFVLLLVVMGAGSALIVYTFLANSPGGMRSHYPADGDRHLTRAAQTALPIIDALEKYHEQHGSYPADVTELRPWMPNANLVGPARPADERHVPMQWVDGWLYLPTDDPVGYVLSLRLGLDPSLKFQWDGEEGAWIFYPGDGSPERPLILNPE